jgi:hypothetical protein
MRQAPFRVGKIRDQCVPHGKDRIIYRDQCIESTIGSMDDWSCPLAWGSARAPLFEPARRRIGPLFAAQSSTFGKGDSLCNPAIGWGVGETPALSNGPKASHVIAVVVKGPAAA